MPNRLISVEDYEPFIGPEPVDRILRKAKALQSFKVVNFNSTFYGGGVAELLSGMTLLMNSLGIKAEWRVIQGRPDFFNITKKMHNALQGADINLSEIKTSIFEAVNFENAVVLQKSLREGFGLTVAEAMWKGTPVIGGTLAVFAPRFRTESTVSLFPQLRMPQTGSYNCWKIQN